MQHKSFFPLDWFQKDKFKDEKVAFQSRTENMTCKISFLNALLPTYLYLKLYTL